MKINDGFTRSTTCVVLLLAMGCQTVLPERSAGSKEPGLQAPAGTPQADSAIQAPAAVQQALLPALELPPPAGDLADEQLYDVAVKDAPAREFFMSLVEETPYDLVVHPAVTGEISLVLKEATIRDILRAVRDVYGYDFRSSRKGFYVLPSKLSTRLFAVNYPNVERSGHSETRVSSGQLTDQVGDSNTTRDPLGPIATGSDRTRGVLESSQVRTDSTASFWSELAESLTAIVGPEDGRSVVVSPQAGSVVVRALPDELRQVAEFLGHAQDFAVRQVVLEAKILEVELDDGYRAGINWGALIESGSKSALLGQTGGGSLLDDPGLSDIAGNSGFLDPRSLSFPSNTDISAFGGAFSAALDISRFTAFIELLETQGSVRVLSSPRVSTVNNQKAVIKVGSDEFFVTDVSTTTVTGTVATTTPDVTLTPFFSGIALDVLPQISGESEVILHVHPSISEVVDQTKEITIGDDTLSLPLALSTIRESDTVVRARNGQMVVIGGLMRDATRTNRASLPWLGRIPYLGKFFGQNQSDQVKSELVILLRPQVVMPGTWAGRLDRLDRRMRSEYGIEESLLDDADQATP